MIRTALKIASIVFAISLSVASWAEDEHYTNAQINQYYAKQNASSVDKQYVLPQNYNGKYYPSEEQGVINYYGTKKTSEAETKDAPYYYYYY